MDVGMLWYDNDPQTTLTAKVARAAAYYRQKYGRVPDLCMVNPSMLPVASPDLAQASAPGNLKNAAMPAPNPQRSPDEGVFTGKPVVLRPNRLIMPGHLWIGQDKNN